MIHDRLIKGAGILGSLWREGNRCGAAWSGICVCMTARTFCLGKKKWIGLVRELHGGRYPNDLSGAEGFLVLECMDEAMFKATGLKILKALPPARALLRIPRSENYFSEVLKLAETYSGTQDDMTGPIVRVQELWTPSEVAVS